MAAIDADTLWLLFGMMALVGLLKETGFFQYVAIRAAKAARGNPTVLFLTLGLATAVASMFLDNVTTLLTIAPVTVSIADVLGLPVAPSSSWRRWPPTSGARPPSSVIPRTSSSDRRRTSRSTRSSPTPSP